MSFENKEVQTPVLRAFITCDACKIQQDIGLSANKTTGGWSMPNGWNAVFIIIRNELEGRHICATCTQNIFAESRSEVVELLQKLKDLQSELDSASLQEREAAQQIVTRVFEKWGLSTYARDFIINDIGARGEVPREEDQS